MKAIFPRLIALLIIGTSPFVGCGEARKVIGDEDPPTPGRCGMSLLCSIAPGPYHPAPSKLLAEPQLFSSCSAVKKYREEIDAEMANITRAYPNEMIARPEVTIASAVSNTASSSSPSSSGDILTNLQEKSVDEADYIKIGSEHIFSVVDSSLRVVARDSLRELANLPQKDLSQIRLFVKEKRVVLVGQLRGNAEVAVRIYDVTPDHTLALAGEVRERGLLHDLRLVGSHLVLAANDWQFLAQVANGSVAESDCERVLKPMVQDNDYGVIRLLSLSLDDAGAPPRRLAMMGASDRLYMTDKHIYLSKENYHWWRQTTEREVVVAKFDFDAKEGRLSYAAAGVVPGYVKDIWAYKELDDGEHLAITTSTGSLQSQAAQAASNHLWVLGQEDRNLVVQGKVSDFGRNENIRAIRYVGSMAYVVSFRNTDPLFAIDLADPRNPQIRDELKVPGFSLYLHPLSDKLMLGVGYDAVAGGDIARTAGLKLSVFDTSDAQALREVHTVVLGERGSSSPVTANHHAFFYDGESSLIGIPVSLINGARQNFQGVVFYSLSPEGQLTEVKRVSHYEWALQACALKQAVPLRSARSGDIDRIFKIDGSYILSSAFGLSRYSSAHGLARLADLPFSGAGVAACAMPPRAFD